MPRYVISKVIEALNAQGKAVKGARVLVVGLAYKPNVDDDRESPSYALIDLLASMGAKVSYFDPFIPVATAGHQHPSSKGMRSIAWNHAAISKFDAAIIATAHADVDHDQLARWSRCVIDTRNAVKKRGPRIWPA